MNINTQEYWEKRFGTGTWNRAGRKQTREYALANVRNISLDPQFTGTILDFGCAQGDALPVYGRMFPQAKICGYDMTIAGYQRKYYLGKLKCKAGIMAKQRFD